MIRKFDKEFLLDIIASKPRGDFFPYSSGNLKEVESYLKQIVDRLVNIPILKVKSDFNHYGSGFSSYVPINLSKRDESDMTIINKGEYKTEIVEGLMLYLCRLAPFAVYAKGNWSTTFLGDKWQSASSHFIYAGQIGTIPDSNWHYELRTIKGILNEYGITILTREELDNPLDFDVMIRTIEDPPYTVFDCLFYWED